MTKGKFKKGTKASKSTKVKKNPLFEKKPRNFRIGGDIRPRRDLTRYVRWPKYILLQRQKRVLLQRLKVPPTINQFTQTIDRNQATTLLNLLRKIQPEDRQKRKQRLLQAAKDKADNKEASTKAPISVQFGLNNVTKLVEEKKARLVVIAHDVDPIETIVWLPQLCRKQDVSFCFIKSKARLGRIVHQKTATCVAITEVPRENHAELENLVKVFKAQYNESQSLRKEWGGGLLGHKSRVAQEAKQRALDKEQLKKAAL
jgi:large subunit ribosomal protein L7Ae